MCLLLYGILEHGGAGAASRSIPAGADPLADQAIEANEHIEAFLTQHTHVHVAHADSIAEMNGEALVLPMMWQK